MLSARERSLQRGPHRAEQGDFANRTFDQSESTHRFTRLSEIIAGAVWVASTGQHHHRQVRPLRLIAKAGRKEGDRVFGQCLLTDNCQARAPADFRRQDFGRRADMRLNSVAHADLAQQVRIPARGNQNQNPELPFSFGRHRLRPFQLWQHRRQ